MTGSIRRVSEAPVLLALAGLVVPGVGPTDRLTARRLLPAQAHSTDTGAGA